MSDIESDETYLDLDIDTDEYDEVNQKENIVYLDTDVIARIKAAETSLMKEKQQLDRYTSQLIITEDMPNLPGICSYCSNFKFVEGKQRIVHHPEGIHYSSIRERVRQGLTKDGLMECNSCSETHTYPTGDQNILLSSHPNDITVKWLPRNPHYDTINVGKGSTKQLGMSLLRDILKSDTPANVLVEDAGLYDLLNNTPLKEIITVIQRTKNFIMASNSKNTCAFSKISYCPALTYFKLSEQSQIEQVTKNRTKDITIINKLFEELNKQQNTNHAFTQRAPAKDALGLEFTILDETKWETEPYELIFTEEQTPFVREKNIIQALNHIPEKWVGESFNATQLNPEVREEYLAEVGKYFFNLKVENPIGQNSRKPEHSKFQTKIYTARRLNKLSQSKN